MRILVAGALGEVGSSVASALRALGHEVSGASSRAPLEGADALALSEAADLIRGGDVDLVVNAAGRGDRRTAERTGTTATAVLGPAIRASGTPAVLLSTTRVLEGLTEPCTEDAAPAPRTPYAQANADNEREWLGSGPSAGVLRIANYFCAPMGRDTPQSLLLPWSLLDEALRTGAIGVRSAPDTSREFVSADDVARALLVVAECPSPDRVCSTAPGFPLTLADLTSAVAEACMRAGVAAPSVQFGTETGSTTQVQAVWLAHRGWQTKLTQERIVDVMAEWIETVT